MGHVTLCETFSSIKWINPNLHFIFVKFIRKLVVIEIGLRSSHAEDLLQILQVTSVCIFVQIKVVDQHFLTDLVLFELVRHDVRFLLKDLSVNLIFLSNDCRSWVQLLKVVDDSVLDMDIRLSEDIIDT